MSAFLVVTWTCGGLLADHPEAQAAGERLAQSAVGTAVGAKPISEASPVAIVAQPHVSKSPQTSPFIAAECDPLGTPVRCFTPPATPATGTYLNVASFFDKRQLSLETHFFLKYYENTAAAAVEITGLGMHVSSNNAGLKTIPAVGVLKTARANPAFPLPADLKELQIVGVPAAALGVETCVEFEEAIRLEADEAAWLVVRFPPAPLGFFIGLLVDDDATEEDCDYLTPDDGQMYFRPDPRNGPAYDWAITAYTQAVASKDALVSKTWSTVKTLYREPDIETTP